MEQDWRETHLVWDTLEDLWGFSCPLEKSPCMEPKSPIPGDHLHDSAPLRAQTETWRRVLLMVVHLWGSVGAGPQPSEVTGRIRPSTCSLESH